MHLSSSPAVIIQQPLLGTLLFSSMKTDIYRLCSAAVAVIVLEVYVCVHVCVCVFGVSLSAKATIFLYVCVERFQPPLCDWLERFTLTYAYISPMETRQGRRRASGGLENNQWASGTTIDHFISRSVSQWMKTDATSRTPLDFTSADRSVAITDITASMLAAPKHWQGVRPLSLTWMMTIDEITPALTTAQNLNVIIIIWTNHLQAAELFEPRYTEITTAVHEKPALGCPTNDLTSSVPDKQHCRLRLRLFKKSRQ